MAWEYKVVPAPVKGVKEKGVKTPEARFALCIEHLLNEMAADDWQFHRAETLPSEERAGLTSTQTVWRHVMIFRRPVEAEEADYTPPVAMIEDHAENAAEPEAEALAELQSDTGGVAEDGASEADAAQADADEPTGDTEDRLTVNKLLSSRKKPDEGAGKDDTLT